MQYPAAQITRKERKRKGSIDTKLLVVGLSESVLYAVPQVKSLKAKRKIPQMSNLSSHTSRNMRKNQNQGNFSEAECNLWVECRGIMV
jgi:hypothetical protein